MRGRVEDGLPGTGRGVYLQAHLEEVAEAVVSDVVLEVGAEGASRVARAAVGEP